jgi:hypothetical protein
MSQGNNRHMKGYTLKATLLACNMAESLLGNLYKSFRLRRQRGTVRSFGTWDSSDQSVINRQTRRDSDRARQSGDITESAYRSVRARFIKIRETELLQAENARKWAGITEPASLYDKRPTEIDPALEAAMQRLWDIGTLSEGRADTDLRRQARDPDLEIEPEDIPFATRIYTDAKTWRGRPRTSL